MRAWAFILIVLIVAAALRLALLAAAWDRPAAVFTPDSADYLELADSLARDGSFERQGHSEIFRTPGYPLAVLAAGGLEARGWHTVSLVQVGLDVGLVYLTYLLGTTLAGRRVGLGGAALLAVSPLAAVASVRILSDGSFAMLLMLALVLIVRHLRTGRLWPLAAGAAVLGADCYIRPVGLAFAAAIAMVLAVPWRRSARDGAGAPEVAEGVGEGEAGRPANDPLGRRLPAALGRAAVFAVVVAAAVSPWIVRNHFAADYNGFSSFSGDSLYYFGAPEVIARGGRIDSASVRDMMHQREQDWARRQPAAPSQGQLAAYRQAEAMAIVRAEPAAYAKIHLAYCLGFWLPAATDVLELLGMTSGNQGTSDVLHRRGLIPAARHYFGDNAGAMLLAAGLSLLALIVYAGAIIQVVRRLRAVGLRLGPEVWMLAILVVLAALLPGPSGFPRYRVPVEPLICVAAAAGWLAVAKSTHHTAPGAAFGRNQKDR